MNKKRGEYEIARRAFLKSVGLAEIDLKNYMLVHYENDPRFFQTRFQIFEAGIVPLKRALQLLEGLPSKNEVWDLTRQAIDKAEQSIEYFKKKHWDIVNAAPEEQKNEDRNIETLPWKKALVWAFWYVRQQGISPIAYHAVGILHYAGIPVEGFIQGEPFPDNLQSEDDRLSRVEWEEERARSSGNFKMIPWKGLAFPIVVADVEGATERDKTEILSLRVKP